ncbi:unnamed protein product [Fusarium venenatum]|uniref:Uncharacterized protein n=1 Tax=Fusarium venenatum TaxID=56646 RepID=A0A2L2TQL9_9HYPO|nr:LOW QUALITY PROTEIN: uncharacterized protein FVRRES_11010 [Fusarium venenatum]CEI70933.1 unnamed protein product [Fusarium venenatum]
MRIGSLIDLHCIFNRTQGNKKTAVVGSTKKCVWRLISLLSWAEIVVEQDAPFSTPKRPSRVVKPMSKVRDTARQLEDTAIEARRITRQTARNVPAEEQIDRPTETRKSSGSGSGSGSSDGRAMLQKALDLLAESRRETKRLQEALKEQTVHEMGKQMVEIKEQMTEEIQRAPRNYRDECNRRTSTIIC